MDKRSILFVVLLSGILFLTNYYFDQKRQEDLRVWNAEQKSLKELKVNNLEKNIQEHTKNLDSLPIVSLYQDADGKQVITSAIWDQDHALTIANKELPATVYVNIQGKMEQLDQVQTKLSDSLVVFSKKGQTTPLSVGELPEFGQFNLQIVNFNPTSVALGQYTDGHFSLPQEQINKLKEELSNQAAHEKNILNENGIALLKVDSTYYPVAVYVAASKHLDWLDEIPNLQAKVFSPSGKLLQPQKEAEKYYVLENPYQQLVFSSVGGALTEINLPFTSPNDRESVVKEIEFDREMVKNHPQNAHFPAHPYLTADNQAHSQGKLGGYYPLIRRDLIQSAGKKSIVIPPRFYALNIVSEYPEVAELTYKVKSFTQNQIVFEAEQPHRKITKTYTIDQEMKGGPYCIDLTIQIEGDSRGLWLTSGVPEVEWISGAPAPALKYRLTRNQKAEVSQIDLPKDATTVLSTTPDWICNSNGFLGLILDPISETAPGYRAQFVSGTVVPSRLVEIDQQYHQFPAENLPGYMTLLPLKGGTTHFRFFAGPFATDILNQVDQTYANPATGYNPDYIACQTFHGWFAFISEPFAKFLFILMRTFYSLTGSWAFSIILLTIALRLMLYPLNAWSMKSTIKMQQIAPEIKAIQEKYKKDPQKAQLEVVNLYREKGINPVSGCFPLLIQMPFLIGMFDLLKSTFELRGASFIPGWIDNLTAPDVLFSWSYPIPFIGTQFHLLPILLGGVMFLQQRIASPAPRNPADMTDQQRQQRSMGSIMAIVFAFMFYNFPSGLNIYWLSSMLLGILQQWWTTKQINKAPIVLPAEVGYKEKK